MQPLVASWRMSPFPTLKNDLLSTCPSFVYFLPPEPYGEGLSHLRRKPHIALFCLCKMSRKGNFIETESRLVVARSWQWEWGLTVNGHVGSYWDDENVLKLCILWRWSQYLVKKKKKLLKLYN